jgi:predicted transcriptional regulator
MLRWRVIKRIPLNEVYSRIRELEEKYENDFSKLHDEFVSGRMTREAFDDYVEWSSMNHAVRAYTEGEDYEYYAEIEFSLEPEEYRKITPRRMELLEQLSNTSVESINELANKIQRDVKNVYLDIKILEELGFIRLVNEGRSMRPELLIQEITLLLS